jgi:hypothetical protein
MIETEKIRWFLCRGFSQQQKIRWRYFIFQT